jgi:hypothetical protein
MLYVASVLSELLMIYVASVLSELLMIYLASVLSEPLMLCSFTAFGAANAKQERCTCNCRNLQIALVASEVTA